MTVWECYRCIASGRESADPRVVTLYQGTALCREHARPADIKSRLAHEWGDRQENEAAAQSAKADALRQHLAMSEKDGVLGEFVSDYMTRRQADLAEAQAALQKHLDSLE